MIESQEKHVKSPENGSADLRVVNYFHPENASHLVELLHVEDFPNGHDLRIVAEVCGLDVAVRLTIAMAGFRLYIPRNVLDEFKRRFILENVGKFSAKQLGVMMDCTEDYIYEILRNRRTQSKEIKDQR